MELNVVFASVESNKWCLTPFIAEKPILWDHLLLERNEHS